MLRFSPNSPGVMYSHTAGYHAKVINVASKHWVQDADVATVPLQSLGGYGYQARCQVQQVKFSSDETTMVYLSFEGSFDFFVAE